MAKNQLWKRLSAIVLAALVAIPAGIINSSEVKAAESIIANGDFDNDSAVDVSGWSVGLAQMEAVKKIVNAVPNGDFEDGTVDDWTITNTGNVAIEVVDDATVGKVLYVGALTTSNKVRKLDSTAVSVPTDVTEVTISFKYKVEGTSSGNVTFSALEYTDSSSTAKASSLLTTKSTNDAWATYSETFTRNSGYTKMAFRMNLIATVRVPVYVDDIAITYEAASDEMVYGDGIIMDGSDYAMKLSDGNSATYSATLTAGNWYEYSYDVHTENAGSGFSYGIKLGDEIKTATTGIFQATEGMTIGFGTNGTGTAYFDNLVVTAHTHNFVQGATDETTIAAEATCEEPAKYYLVCEGCGTKDVNTFVSGTAKGHEAVATPEKDATCTENGNIAYWTCDVCDKVFSDVDCKTETTVENSIVAKHTQAHTARVDATCTADGNIEYWTCSCGKIYSDATCTNVVTDVVIPKHTQEHTVAVEETCTEFGNIEYWTCSCGKVYADEACTEDITGMETVIAPHVQGNVPAVEATCTENGNIEYWACACGKLYADSLCTTEITEADTVIAKHVQSYKKEVASTATKTGVKAHYECSCGVLYADEACTKKVVSSELIIAKKKVTVAKTSVKKVTAKKKAITIKWKKKTGVTGYEIQISLKKNFKKIAKKVIVKGDKQISKTINKLKSGKKYYVRIRTYKVVDGGQFVSEWVKFKKATKVK